MIRIEFPKFLAWFQTPQTVTYCKSEPYFLGRSVRFEPFFFNLCDRFLPARVFTFGSREAIFADHIKVHPHFEDDP